MIMLVKETQSDVNYSVLKDTRVLKVSWVYILYGVVLLVMCLLGQKQIAKLHERCSVEDFKSVYWRYEEVHHHHLLNDFVLNGPLADSPDTSKEGPDTFRIICYYVIKSNDSTHTNLPPESIDPYYCTHIIVGFSSVNNNTIQPISSADLDIFKKVISLKTINPTLKVLLSVEEISSTGEFSRMVSSPESREQFTKDTLSFLKNVGFDGLDLDWEFPSWPNADLIQVKNFTLLLSTLRRFVNNEFKGIILSTAVAAPEVIIQQSYEIEEMAKLVDFVNIMAYDYHMFSPYLPMTGPNAPLFARSVDEGYFLTLNTNWSASHWALWGMPPSKINVGIPTYGHSFTLINENNNGWNAPASDFGTIGSYGFTTFPDACNFKAKAETTHFFDDAYQVPYAFLKKEWISYEDEKSVEFKALYVKNMKFGGAMIYSLNSDDISGVCGSRKFPLTRRINDILTESK